MGTSVSTRSCRHLASTHTSLTQLSGQEEADEEETKSNTNHTVSVTAADVPLLSTASKFKRSGSGLQCRRRRGTLSPLITFGELNYKHLTSQRDTGGDRRKTEEDLGRLRKT